MFGIGTTELLIVLAVVLLLFGNRLPSTMRSLGRSMIEFKRGLQGAGDPKASAKPGATADEKISRETTAPHSERKPEDKVAQS